MPPLRSITNASWLLKSFLLHFAYIEQAEARSETSDCAVVFAQLLQWVHDQIDVLRAALDAKLADIDAEGTQALAEAAARRRDAGEADENVGGEERADFRKQDEERAARKASEEAVMRPIIEELKEAASLVWIKQMHFVRRTEGRRPSRAIFGRARKSPHCTWQVYEANALMEFHCSKDVGVATKVFELALKTFGSDEAFVVRYLDFLISINDDNSKLSSVTYASHASDYWHSQTHAHCLSAPSAPSSQSELALCGIVGATTSTASAIGHPCSVSRSVSERSTHKVSSFLTV